MIPLRLELRNFMAYREADPLDFSGLHTVVLTGENGAGKSTLLDAITWAVWGVARARRDDELIAQGEADMRVDFTFSEGRSVYRVVRTRRLGKAAARGKAPTSTGTLDFLIEDGGSWRTLSEPRASDTQAKIERALNLTYETFINSAYLKQGRADEFTLKTPAERKTLLAEILSLDVWQEYERRVKDRQDAAAREENLRAVRLKEMDADILRLPEHERELEQAQHTVARAQAAMAQTEAEVVELHRARERERGLAAQLSQAHGRLSAAEAELDKIAADAIRHREALAAYQAALDQRAEIERGFADFEAAQAEVEALNVKLTSMVELNARKTAADNAIADARRALESERDGLRRRATELARWADDAPLRAQHADAARQLEALELEKRALAELMTSAAHLREAHAATKAQNDELRRRMRELKERIDALSTVGAICPTCGRELAEADRVRIHAEWMAEGRRMGDEYRANEAALAELARERKAQDERAGEMEASQRRYPGAQREHSALEERLAQAAAAAQQLPAVQAELGVADGVLDRGEYAAEARASLAAVLRELAELGYDGARHAHLRASLAELRGFVERRARLDRAEIGVQAEERALESLTLREAAARQHLAVVHAQASELRSAIAELQTQLRRGPEVEAAHARAHGEFSTAQRKVGEALQKVQACKALEGMRDALIRELGELRHRQSLLSELREACGKNGVPAMIVETVLPQLESSANELLGRMSSGRMNIRFETQRATQAGTMSETLELRISDELGERAYEMFSGGEAFRINFAVRIALSKLLAHRAGARLQTLFIDEGFGTQDAQGRERLVEAVRAIEGDFSRVFIITHIDELKDVFPARIEVTKTSRGSTARVI